jgi:hypothetical protein
MAEEVTLDTEIRKIILKSILKTARDIHHPQNDKVRVKRLIQTFKELEEKCPEFDYVLCEAEKMYGDKGVFLSDLMLELKKLGSAHDDLKNIPGIKDRKEYNKLIWNENYFVNYKKKLKERFQKIFPAISSMLVAIGY